MSQVSKLYRDYEHQPFISDKRNLSDWESFPDKYPYGVVSRKQMTMLEEGLFPGDIVMLWRIGFNNFTNESWIPDYFEYRYGVNSDESLARLIDKGYVVEGGPRESLALLNGASVKRILKTKHLKVSGKKSELLERVLVNFTEDELAKLYPLRQYVATLEGRELINKYDDIIQTHGPKNL